MIKNVTTFSKHFRYMLLFLQLYQFPWHQFEKHSTTICHSILELRNVFFLAEKIVINYDVKLSSQSYEMTKSNCSFQAWICMPGRRQFIKWTSDSLTFAFVGSISNWCVYCSNRSKKKEKKNCNQLHV